MKTSISILLYLFSLNLYSQDTLSHRIQKKLLLETFGVHSDTVFTKDNKIEDIIHHAKESIILETSITNLTYFFNDFNSYESFKWLLKNIDSTTYLDFINKLSVQSKIDTFPISKSELEIKYIDDNTLKKVFDVSIEGYEKLWAYLGTKSYTPLVGISNVGFNRMKTQAAVYYSKSYAPLGGAGYISLYELRGNSWILIETKTVWIS